MAKKEAVESGKPLVDRLTWDDVIVNCYVKEILQDFCTNKLLDVDSYLKWGDKPLKGVLLYGPAGTGKSLILRIMGTLTPFPFFLVDVGNTGSKYINESANKLDRYFRRVANIAADKGAAIICFDEIDGLLMTRDNTQAHTEDHKVVTTFTKHMDGLSSCSGVYVIAATNMELEQMDPAVIRAGRFDTKFYVGLPDEKSRADIFKLHLEKREAIAKKAGNPLFMLKIDYAALASKTSEFSGADINSLLKEVCNQKRRKMISAHEYNPVTTGDLIKAISLYQLTSQQGRKELGFKT